MQQCTCVQFEVWLSPVVSAEWLEGKYDLGLFRALLMKPWNRGSGGKDPGVLRNRRWMKVSGDPAVVALLPVRYRNLGGSGWCEQQMSLLTLLGIEGRFVGHLTRKRVVILERHSCCYAIRCTNWHERRANSVREKHRQTDQEWTDGAEIATVSTPTGLSYQTDSFNLCK